MELIIISMICIGLCYKGGDWKNWRRYYPTIIFYVVVAITSHIITVNKPLWVIHNFFNIDILANYFMSFFIAPSIIILFLSNYPNQKIKQIVHIIFFVSIPSLIEYIGYLRKTITYHNGWSFGWTIILYIGMFSIIRLHYKKPILACLIFFAMVVGGMFYFNISLSDLK